jgi:FXSXX-COOH protein
MDDDGGDLGLALIDLSGVDLARLAELPDTALAVSLRQILADDARLADRYSGFESALP